MFKSRISVACSLLLISMLFMVGCSSDQASSGSIVASEKSPELSNQDADFSINEQRGYFEGLAFEFDYETSVENGNVVLFQVNNLSDQDVIIAINGQEASSTIGPNDHKTLGSLWSKTKDRILKI